MSIRIHVPVADDVPALLAEVERLRDALSVMESAWSVCNDDRTELEGALADAVPGQRVRALADEWDDGHDGTSRRFCPSCVRVDELRALLREATS